MARAELTVKLRFEFYTLDDVHELANFINKVVLQKDTWRGIAIDGGERARAIIKERDDANALAERRAETIGRVNGFADNWADLYCKAKKDADLSREILQDMKEASMDFIHASAILVDDLKNEVADLEEEADDWCDSYGVEADEVRGLKAKADVLKGVRERLNTPEGADIYRHAERVATEAQGNTALVIHNNETAQENARLRGEMALVVDALQTVGKRADASQQDKAALVDALRPWWDSENTGDSDEDHALIDALPDWVVNDLTREQWSGGNHAAVCDCLPLVKS